jgi:hypothetical protein
MFRNFRGYPDICKFLAGRAVGDKRTHTVLYLFWLMVPRALVTFHRADARRRREVIHVASPLVKSQLALVHPSRHPRVQRTHTARSDVAP